MTLTHVDGGRVSTIHEITKLEAVFSGPNCSGEVVAYLVYTGGRPTEHRYHSRVEIGEVTGLTANVPYGRREPP